VALKSYKSLSEHCCSLAKHLFILSFADWNCFAQCLTLNVCDLEPSLCGVKRIRNITIKPALKEMLLKSIQKGTGILY